VAVIARDPYEPGSYRQLADPAASQYTDPP